MTLIEHFKTLYHVDDELELFFESISETREYAKGDLIFEPNSYLKHIYFIESGFTRMYYYKTRNNITHYFFGNMSSSTAIVSVFYQTPSLYGFQALPRARTTLLPFGPIRELTNQSI